VYFDTLGPKELFFKQERMSGNKMDEDRMEAVETPLDDLEP
jgi:hypothetical protein